MAESCGTITVAAQFAADAVSVQSCSASGKHPPNSTVSVGVTVKNQNPPQTDPAAFTVAVRLRNRGGVRTTATGGGTVAGGSSTTVDVPVKVPSARGGTTFDVVAEVTGATEGAAQLAPQDAQQPSSEFAAPVSQRVSRAFQLTDGR